MSDEIISFESLTGRRKSHGMADCTAQVLVGAGQGSWDLYSDLDWAGERQGFQNDRSNLRAETSFL
jgi:hypothetical protein